VGAEDGAVHVQKGHGRTTTRRIETSTRLNEELEWPQVGQVFRIVRTTRRGNGMGQTQVSYGITSLSPAAASPAALLEIVRQHWTIENRCHWVRDVVFDEDRSQVRSGHAHQVMAALRNAAIALIRLDGSFAIAASLRRFAAQPDRPIQLVFGAL
jgi:predicted transposase YbfD/YdcC